MKKDLDHTKAVAASKVADAVTKTKKEEASKTAAKVEDAKK